MGNKFYRLPFSHRQAEAKCQRKSQRVKLLKAARPDTEGEMKTSKIYSPIMKLQLQKQQKSIQRLSARQTDGVVPRKAEYFTPNLASECVGIRLAFTPLPPDPGLS
ncbi:hypothetical protein GWI33_009567 [Rhynchophorus ferrugineus]|uniref:Uncharacterized protein n=1 Tax=Rhynchophorus ferrugineus TaxID=354439 RepID=A0A834MEM9_RHYFE|nr:hypothetical protein GWI33_009567 [Rhynchophorus ferrugineus]